MTFEKSWPWLLVAAASVLLIVGIVATNQGGTRDKALYTAMRLGGPIVAPRPERVSLPPLDPATVPDITVPGEDVPPRPVTAPPDRSEGCRWYQCVFQPPS